MRRLMTKLFEATVVNCHIHVNAVECENGVDSTSCPEGESCVENEDGIFTCEADRKTGTRKRGSKKGKSKSRRN